MSKGRGDLQDTARKMTRQSQQDRRGPMNPNRQRQPKRLGMAGRLMSRARSLISRSIKGPDLGGG